MTVRRNAAGLALFVTLAVGTSACSLLYPDWAMGELDPMPLPDSTAMTTYSVGSASLDIEQDGVTEQLALQAVGPGSQLDPMLGATVNWRNGDGWFVVVSAYGGAYGYGDPALGGGISGDLTIQRVSGNDIWTASGWGEFGSRCIVEFDEMSPVALKGTATCRGLRWADGATGSSFAAPAYIEGQPAFDAAVAFEAWPTDTQATDTT